MFLHCFGTFLPGRIGADTVFIVNLVSTWKPYSRTSRHLSCFHDSVERPCFYTVSTSTTRCAIFSLFVNIGTGLFLCCFDRIRQSSTADRKYIVKQHRGQHRNSNDGLLGDLAQKKHYVFHKITKSHAMTLKIRKETALDKVGRMQRFVIQKEPHI